MKVKFTLLSLLFVLFVNAQVGIGTTTPNSQLDIRSSNQASPASTDGILIPKVDAFPVVNPTAAQQGMLVYLTTAVGLKQPGFYYWDNPTANWLGFGASNAWTITGNAGTSVATNFLGTTDNVPLAFRTANTERMRVTNGGSVVVNNATAAAGDVFSAYAAGTNYAVNGYSTGSGTAGFFASSGTGSAVSGYVTGTSAIGGDFWTRTAANNQSTVDIYNQTGIAPALYITTDLASATADGIEMSINGAAAKRGIDMYLGATNTGIGAAIFHNGTGRCLNIEQLNAATTQPTLFASSTGNARTVNAQSSNTTHTQQIGFFSQGSTGLANATYNNAAAVWGQSTGIRGGVFLGGGASANTTCLQGAYSGILGNYDGVGVFGQFSPADQYGYGVVGQGNWFGVFANGDSGASGIKAFQIDHPQDPENKYLRHYSMESPEVLNMYRGNINLDQNGEAVVVLPPYFDEININFSYHLTPIGSQANLYVKEEIQGNQFMIAGGSPNQKVSWQVFAERNDLYLQQNPESKAVEVAKKDHDRGLYLKPELYGQPEEKGIFHRYKADPSKVTAVEKSGENKSESGKRKRKETAALSENTTEAQR